MAQHIARIVLAAPAVALGVGVLAAGDVRDAQAQFTCSASVAPFTCSGSLIGPVANIDFMVSEQTNVIAFTSNFSADDDALAPFMGQPVDPQLALLDLDSLAVLDSDTDGASDFALLNGDAFMQSVAGMPVSSGTVFDSIVMASNVAPDQTLRLSLTPEMFDQDQMANPDGFGFGDGFRLHVVQVSPN